MEFAQQIVAALGVLGLMLGTLWYLSRRGLARFNLPRLPRGSARRMQVAERVALTPQHSLHLVRIGDTGFLIGVSPSSCNTLQKFEWSELESGQPFLPGGTR